MLSLTKTIFDPMEKNSKCLETLDTGTRLRYGFIFLLFLIFRNHYYFINGIFIISKNQKGSAC